MLHEIRLKFVYKTRARGGRGEDYEKYETMGKGAPFRISNILYDVWTVCSKKQMKVIHEKFHSSKSIIEEVEK